MEGTISSVVTRRSGISRGVLHEHSAITATRSAHVGQVSFFYFPSLASLISYRSRRLSAVANICEINLDAVRYFVTSASYIFEVSGLKCGNTFLLPQQSTNHLPTNYFRNFRNHPLFGKSPRNDLISNWFLFKIWITIITACFLRKNLRVFAPIIILSIRDRERAEHLHLHAVRIPAILIIHCQTYHNYFLSPWLCLFREFWYLWSLSVSPEIELNPSPTELVKC